MTEHGVEQEHAAVSTSGFLQVSYVAARFLVAGLGCYGQKKGGPSLCCHSRPWWLVGPSGTSELFHEGQPVSSFF